METQDFIKLLEDLKNAGFFYNDADFCRKMGIGTSRLSMMKTTKRQADKKKKPLFQRLPKLWSITESNR